MPLPPLLLLPLAPVGGRSKGFTNSRKHASPLQQSRSHGKCSGTEKKTRTSGFMMPTAACAVWMEPASVAGLALVRLMRSSLPWAAISPWNSCSGDCMHAGGGRGNRVVKGGYWPRVLAKRAGDEGLPGREGKDGGREAAEGSWVQQRTKPSRNQP